MRRLTVPQWGRLLIDKGKPADHATSRQADDYGPTGGGRWSQRKPSMDEQENWPEEAP
jgi:hypothetical protein